MKAIIKSIIPVTHFTKDQLKVGMVIKVATKDTVMNGVIVLGHDTREPFFCPLTIVKGAKSYESSTPLDLWPLENLYFNSGEVTLFNGTITISN